MVGEAYLMIALIEVGVLALVKAGLGSQKGQ
jgi:hypothetical protein